MMKKFKSMLSLLAASVMALTCFTIPAFAADDGEPVKIISDVEVPEEVVQEILNDHPDALGIHIYEYYEVPEKDSSKEEPSISPAWVSRVINIEKETTRTDVFYKDEFVISVARGETKQLTQSTTYSLEASVTGKAKVSELKLNSKLSYTYTKTQTWTGPDNTNPTANTREYRIKFYQNEGTYTGVYQFGPTGMGFEEVEGTWTEPSKYLSYSIDRRV